MAKIRRMLKVSRRDKGGKGDFVNSPILFSFSSGRGIQSKNASRRDKGGKGGYNSPNLIFSFFSVRDIKSPNL